MKKVSFDDALLSSFGNYDDFVIDYLISNKNWSDYDFCVALVILDNYEDMKASFYIRLGQEISKRTFGGAIL